MTTNPTPRCLIVDDEPVILDLAGRILKDSGFELMTAPSASEALKILEAHPIDVMLTDIVMPDMDGIRLAAEVKARFPRIVIVMLTGRADEDALAAALSAGAADYLAKPFGAADLVGAVKRAFELHGHAERPTTP